MDIIETYERYCQYVAVIRNYSPLTLRNGRLIVKIFVRETKLSDLRAVTSTKAQEYLLNGRIEKKWQPNTYISHHKYLNVFWKWCIKQGYVQENPFALIEKPKLEKRLPRRLSREQAELLIDTALHMHYRYSFERHRAHAIITTMLFTGLRRQEILNLKLHDVDLESGILRVIQGKGRKDRIIPMNMKLRTILERYVKERNQLGRDSLYFFISRLFDGSFPLRGFIRLITRLKERTKLDFSAHSLRHTFATLMLEGGCDIYTLSRLMGHSDISTTTIYLSASAQLLTSSIEKHPLGFQGSP